MTTTKPTLYSRIRDDGLPLYFIGAYALTWLFWVPAVLMEQGQLDLPIPSFALMVLGGLGPMLAAILVSVYHSGSTGVRALFGQLKRWRVGSIWYVITFVGIPVVVFSVAVVHLALGGSLATETIPGILVSLPFQFVFVALIGGGLDEEMGWRGYALPRLQDRYHPVVANLVLGVLWSCWHLPLFFMSSDLFVRSPFALYLVEVTAVSFVFGWIYNSTGGSLLFAVLAHTVRNVSVSGLENLVFSTFLDVTRNLQYEVIEAVVWVLVVVAIVARTRGTLNAQRVPSDQTE